MGLDKKLASIQRKLQSEPENLALQLEYCALLKRLNLDFLSLHGESFVKINSAKFPVNNAELVVSRAQDSRIDWRVLDLYISTSKPTNVTKRHRLKSYFAIIERIREFRLSSHDSSDMKGASYRNLKSMDPYFFDPPLSLSLVNFEVIEGIRLSVLRRFGNYYWICLNGRADTMYRTPSQIKVNTWIESVEHIG